MLNFEHFLTSKSAHREDDAYRLQAGLGSPLSRPIYIHPSTTIQIFQLANPFIFSTLQV